MAFQRPPAVRRGGPGSAPPPRQRRYLRAPVDLAATYLLDGTEPARDAHVSDLGGGGCRLATGDELPPGAVLQLRFPMPGSGDDVAATGKVVMSFYNGSARRFEHGVAFLQIDAGRAAEIVRYVSEQLPGQEPG